MEKLQFAKVLLSRFRASDSGCRYNLLNAIIAASEDPYIENEEGTHFDEWAQTIAELLFPEMIGDVIMRKS